MAAPTFVKATAGLTDAGGAWTYTVDAPAQAGNLIIVQVYQDGVAGTHSITSATNCTNIAGTANLFTDDNAGGTTVGASVGKTWLYFARSTGTSAIVITGANSGADDIYVRAYEFTNVDTGTTLNSIREGHSVSGGVTSGTVADQGVTTTGADRLALNFVALADDAMGLAAFAGETGGDWTLATAIYETATGTDATLGLMQAAMPSAGTINGGSDAITSIGWGVIGFALIPAAAAVDNQPPPGGGTAGGRQAAAVIGAAAQGATAQGATPSPRAVLTMQGALAGGVAPTATAEPVTETPVFGGAVAGGLAARAVATVPLPTGGGGSPVVDTFTVASAADNGYGLRDAVGWANISTGTFSDRPYGTDIVLSSKITAGAPIGDGYCAVLCAVLRWDTSSIPDDATITAAQLRLYVNGYADPHDWVFGFDFYDYGGNPVVAADWELSTSGDAIASIDPGSLTTSAVNDLDFTGLTGINVSGYTGLRSGAVGTGVLSGTSDSYVEYAGYGHSSGEYPKLEVTYVLAGAAGPSAGGFGPIAVVAVTAQGAAAGGTAPTTVGPVVETPAFGGATVGGVTPSPRAVLTAQGALAAGVAASPQAVLTAQGATAQGLTAAPRATSGQGGATGQGTSPAPRTVLTAQGAAGQGTGAAVVVPLTLQGAPAGGTAPSAGGATTETPVPGGGIAGGTSPAAQAVSAAGGAGGQGSSPAPRAVLTAQGAVAGGNAPSAPLSETVGFGGATAAGVSPVARVSVTAAGAQAQGSTPAPTVVLSAAGAIAQGRAPSVPLSETPTPGGALSGGVTATVKVPTTLAGIPAGAQAPAPTVLFVSQGATAQGVAVAKAIITAAAGGAISGGREPLEFGPAVITLTFFDAPTPAGGAAQDSPEAGVYPGSPTSTRYRGSPEASAYRRPSPSKVLV